MKTHDFSVLLESHKKGQTIDYINILLFYKIGYVKMYKPVESKDC